MTRPALALVSVAALALARPQAAPAQGFTVGVYDEQTTATNRVDRTAAGSGITLERFAARVEEGFTRDFGGVLNGDILSGSYTYGTSQGRTILMPSGLGVGLPNGQAAPISGTAAFAFSQASTAGTPNTIQFGAISGGAAGERVVDVGFTVLASRDWAHPTVRAAAVLDNGARQTISPVAIPQGAGTNDTFFGFSAPAGRSIARVEVGYEATNGFVRAWVDDVGFKTAVVGTHLEAGTLRAVGQATRSGATYAVQPGGFNAQEVAFAGVDRRGVMEFALPQAGSPVRVHEVLLEFSVNALTSSGTSLPELSVFGYAGDGTLSAADATASSLLIGRRRVDDLGVFTVSLDATYVEGLMNNGQDLGLLLRSLFDGHQVGVADTAFGDLLAPTLIVRFTPVPEPAGLLAVAAVAAAGWRVRRNGRRGQG